MKTNLDEIKSSFNELFKNNSAFKKNKEAIFDFIEDKFYNYSTWSEDYNDTYNYIICMDEYYEDYLEKYKLNKNLVTVVKQNITNFLLTATSEKGEDNFEKKFTEGKNGAVYFYIYSSDDYFWIDTGVEGKDEDDIFSIGIIPEYELEEI